MTPVISTLLRKSASTICLHRDVQSGVLNFALDEDLLTINPALGITKRLNLSRAKKEVESLTYDALSHFLETSKKKAPV